MDEASDVPAAAGVPEQGPDEGAKSAERDLASPKAGGAPVVRYWQRECGDTEGRGIIELTPFEGTAKRYKVDVTFQKGQKAQRVVFEIEADSAEEAFDRYDERMAEEKAKFEAKAGQTSLIVGPGTKIDQFRQQKMGRKRGRLGGNGGRRIRLP